METTLDYEPKRIDQGVALGFQFDGQANPAFEEKVRKFLESIIDIFPFCRQLKLTIRSALFPHLWYRFFGIQHECVGTLPMFF